ncbi:MAG TPA: LamG-like jellyroll fold domain-containing protein [Verrucomicrobiae bacterium]|nr:LamG-like jellyroll fold domain-containing protein [Verrucomicrobiae bacterium]
MKRTIVMYLTSIGIARQRIIHLASKTLAGAILALVALPCLLSAQTLQHRYSFVSDASDSVGGVSGTVVSPNGGSPVTINNGLTLPGGGGPGFSGYVTLPAGILNTTTNVTVEFWAAQSAANGWAETWSFNSGTPSYWAFISDGQNNSSHVEQALRLNNNETDSQSGVGMAGTETHYTVTFNASTLVDTVWQGQSVIASATAPNNSYTPGVQNFSTCFIGQDPWSDPQWQGVIYEFRIYNGALSSYQIAVDDVAGPTNVVSNWTPASVTFVPSSTNLVLTDVALSTIDTTLAVTGTNIFNATLAATNFVSSNPNVLQVNPSSGVITAVGLGNATVSATVNGVTATSPTIFVTGAQTLLHRYSFVSDASDSVGGPAWNGTLVAPNGGTNATISNGLVLPGGGGGGYSGYVAFPGGILTNTTSLTVETWVTQNTANQWATIWDFANNGSQNFEMCPFPQRGILNLDVADTPNGGEVDAITGNLFPSGQEVYTAFTFNAGTLTGSIYTNGALAGLASYPNTTYIPGAIGGSAGTSQNWLGNDIYGDSQFQGAIYEFRIWNGAVTPVYTAIASAAGPSVIVTNTTPTSLAIDVANSSMIGSQTQQASAVGNFTEASGVNVTGGATNWISSNPSVLTVNQSGLITAVSGGTATVSATVSGVTATSATITVATTPPIVPQYPSNATVAVNDSVSFSVSAIGGALSYQWNFNGNPIAGATTPTLILTNVALTSAGTYSVHISNTAGSTNVSAVLTVDQAILEHRYSFVSDASDSVGGANGTIVAPNGGSAATIANGLSLPGNTHGGFAYSGYVLLPHGLLTNTTSVTIETWVTQNSRNEWATLWDFANSTAVNFELCPAPAPGRNNGNTITAFEPNNNEDDLNTSIPFPNGSEQYVALTVNAASLLADLYTNGASIATLTLPNSTYVPHNIGGSSGTVSNMLGNDIFGDNQFSGTVYEFRIWDGAVTPLYEAVAAVAGPSVVVTNLNPTAIDVTVTNYTMVQGQTQPASALGNFTEASGVSVSGAVTNWSSSNTGVLTVSPGAVVTAVGTGNATISATVNGTTGTSSIISVPSSPPIITQQPATNETFLQGGTLVASVSNIGTPPFVYRWFFDNGATPISTSSSPALTIPNVQLSSAGTYTVLVSNLDGSIMSSNLVVSIVTPSPYEQTVLQYGPVAYWPLQETSGTIAYDVIGGDNGTYMTTTATGSSFSLAQAGPSQSFFGGSSSAVQFASAIADIPQGQLNITGPITITAWVQVFTAAQFASIVGHGDNSWRISITENGAPGGALPGGNDGGSASDATAPATDNINDATWHMVAYTYTGNPGQANNGSLYLDGVLVASNTITAAPTGANLDVWIGGSPDYGTGRLLTDADVAHVAVFNQAFTGAQVQGLYNGTFVLGPQTLHIAPAGANVVVSWQTGTLLQSTNILGPWTTNSAAASPYTVPATNKATFFRLLVP